MQYFLVLAIFMVKNHKNVKLGKKCAQFREKKLKSDAPELCPPAPGGALGLASWLMNLASWQAPPKSQTC